MRKILKLKKDGYTNKQISEELNLSLSFVKRRGTKRFLETQKRLEAKKKEEKDFEKMVIEYLPYSNSLNHLCKHIGIRGVKGYYNKINRVIDKYGLSIEHFGTIDTYSGRNTVRMSDEEFFINGKRRSSSSILKRLVENGYKEYKCENPECGISKWCGKGITLQVHHINGNHNDNRLENLQILCPNCHTQTDNYGSKNKKHNIYKPIKSFMENEEILRQIKKKEVRHCKRCGKEIKGSHSFCSHECYSLYNRKFEVDAEQLIKDFEDIGSFAGIGKKYGVSDNAIRKRCKKLGILEEMKSRT